MNSLKSTHLAGLGKKYQGKVRDFYIVKDKRILITTDRISAFDRILGEIPGKGQVLNLLSYFWFEKTKRIIKNHVIKLPHPNVLIAKNATPIPLEMIVRGYITGVTNTSIWGSYEKGERVIYGIKFPHGLSKNQKLKTPVITPTTKAEKGHDERLTRNEIIKRKIVSRKIYAEMEKAALALFKKGTTICAKAGIILVDTKYEFGLLDGKLILIDEIHTPDSSRYFYADGYQEKFDKGEQQRQLSKEFVREWLMENNFSGQEGEKVPEMTDAIVTSISDRYIELYEHITGEKFIKAVYDDAVYERIECNVKNMLARL